MIGLSAERFQQLGQLAGGKIFKIVTKQDAAER
jgi:hypothetical protein